MLRSFGVADIDLAVERTRDGVTLFRVIEQKQSAHQFKGSQAQIMAVLAALIDHAQTCKDFTSYQLAPDSGAYVAFGEIIPASGTGQSERQRLWLPDQLTVQRLGGNPESVELTRLDFLLWLASATAQRLSRVTRMRQFMKPEALVDYVLAENAPHGAVPLSASDGTG
jgi:hypothetical protein